MPNHVINSVRFDSRLDEIREYVKSEEHGIFDFNKIIPMPDDVYASREVLSSNPLWYNWSVENWGTKWNCYEMEHCHEGFQFWTAWSTPEPIFIALSRQFPDVTITVDFADEDTGGGNCGTFILSGGDVQSFEQGDREFSCGLWGYEPVEEEDENEF